MNILIHENSPIKNFKLYKLNLHVIKSYNIKNMYLLYIVNL